MKKLIYIKYIFLFLLMQECLVVSAQNQHVIDSLQNVVKSSKSDTMKISALIRISIQYLDANPDKAFEYGLQALTLSIKLNYPQSIGKAHNNLGNLYWYKNDYESSSYHYFKALKIYEDLNDKASIADCYRNVGWIYYQQKNFIEALNYFNKGLVINRELNMKKKMCTNYNDIGIIFKEQKKYSEAIESYCNALKMLEETNSKHFMAVVYDNMSIVYDKMGKLSLAIESNEKSVKISEEFLDKPAIAYSNLSGLYIKAGKYNEAIISLQKALGFAKAVNDKSLIKDIYNNFSKFHEKQNDFRKALAYKQMALALTDSIYNESNTRQVNEITAKYESEKKELAIDSLEKDKALSEEKLESEKNFKIYLLFFCLFIAAFAFVLFRGNVQKRKANAALSFAYEEIESKNKDISDSINYSKRIQDASLAPKELKYKLFPDAFVLFKPKDIVSGDFYWFAEKDGKRLIASCDCTGHGVPGALMSMIGNNILNQIVNEKGITAPAEILNHLHKEVRTALKQDEQGATKDGMDIALISFNTETEIEYAGAHRPLWILSSSESGFGSVKEGAEVRQSRSSEETIEKGPQISVHSPPNCEVTEIKPDKFSIGGYQSETERKFTSHKISLSKGDGIYIFSDGFVDQFGGKDGKKYMSKRFKDILLANYSMPMLEQENTLIKTFETWKGSHEQVDDVLVIGIRI